MKKKTIITTLGILTTIVAIVGVTFAYFYLYMQGTPGSVIATAAKVGTVSYEVESIGTNLMLEPGWTSGRKSVSISLSASNVPADYECTLNFTTREVSDLYLQVFNITGTSANVEYLSSTEITSDTVVLSSGTLNGGDTHEIEYVVSFQETGEDQSDQSNMNISGNVSCSLNTAPYYNVYNTATKKYTVRRVYSSSNTSTAWERMDDNVGKVAVATKDGSAVENDFDKIYPWSAINSYIYDRDTDTIVAEYGDANYNPDGTQGDVLTRIPQFYYKRWREGDYEYMSISGSPQTGYTKSEEFSVGRYRSTYLNNEIRSISGYVPEVSRNITWFRTESRKVGDYFGQLDYRYFLLQMLYLVEYADFNSQNILGSGTTNMRINGADKSVIAENAVNRIVINNNSASKFNVGEEISIGTSSAWSFEVAKDRTITAIEDYDSENKAIYFNGSAVNIAVNNVIWNSVQRNGRCDSLGMKSGSFSSEGKGCLLYRGIEDFFGNGSTFVDGININDYVAYISTNPNDYQIQKYDGSYTALGYINGNTNGRTTELGYDSNNPLISFPISVVSQQYEQYTTDSYGILSGECVLHVGGGTNMGNNAGLWQWNCTTVNGSSTNLTSRLLKYK